MVSFQLTNSDNFLALVKRPRAIKDAKPIKSLFASYIKFMTVFSVLKNKLF